MKPLNARMLATCSPAQKIPEHQYIKITLDELCNNAGIKKRITSDYLPNYYYSFDTDINYSHSTGKYAGVKSLKKLDKQEFSMRLLEIYAYSFLNYPVRECVCNRGYFVAPIIEDIA